MKEYIAEQFRDEGYIRLDVRNHDFIRVYKKDNNVLIDFDENDKELTANDCDHVFYEQDDEGQCKCQGCGHEWKKEQYVTQDSVFP